MKLHNLVTDPSKLKTYGKYISAEDAYDRICVGDQNPRLVNAIAKDPKYAYEYAFNIIKGRFPKGEKVIAKDFRYSFYYARDIIKGRWPEGEKTIIKSSISSYYYLCEVLGYDPPSRVDMAQKMLQKIMQADIK